MFYLVAVGLAIFLDLLLLSKRSKSQADWLLAFWLLVMAMHMVMFTVLEMKVYPVLWGLDMPLPLLHGPCLYLYTRSLTGSTVNFKTVLLHFALPGVMYVYLLPFIFSPIDYKMMVYENQGAGYETFLFIRAICIPLTGVVYVLLSTMRLRQHRRAIVEQFSTVEKVNLAWLQYLILWLAGIWVLVIVAGDAWIFGATVVFIFFIGFFGIRQGVIFSSQSPDHQPRAEHEVRETNPTPDVATEKLKYQKSGLSPEGAAILHRQMTELMVSERLYADSELTLVALASRMNALPNHVSQVINEVEGKSFYDYVNGLRVQAFLKILREPDSQRLTLFALAQKCGFNSKSSFNRYFKKFTGQSPSEYADAAEGSEK